jgi:hypothetical protein
VIYRPVPRHAPQPPLPHPLLAPSPLLHLQSAMAMTRYYLPAALKAAHERAAGVHCKEIMGAWVWIRRVHISSRDHGRDRRGGDFGEDEVGFMHPDHAGSTKVVGWSRCPHERPLYSLKLVKGVQRASRPEWTIEEGRARSSSVGATT